MKFWLLKQRFLRIVLVFPSLKSKNWHFVIFDTAHNLLIKFYLIKRISSIFLSFLAWNRSLMPATLLKKRLWHRCFPVNFAKFLRTPFLQKTFGGWFWWYELTLAVIYMYIYIYIYIYKCTHYRGRSRAAATSKMEYFVTVNGFAAALDLPLHYTIKIKN